MRSEFIERDLYNRVFQYMQYDNVLAMRVALETGLRIDDVMSLEAQNLTGNTIRCIAKKTGKSCTKVIPANLAKQLRNNSANGWLFPSPSNPNKHKTRQSVWKDIRKACELSGITQHVTPHSSRKTYAVDVFREEGITSAQRKLQHNRIETTMLYAFSDIMTGRSKQSTFSEWDIEKLAEYIAEKIIEYLEARR